MTIQLINALALIQSRIFKADVSFRGFVCLCLLRKGPQKLGDLAPKLGFSGVTPMTSLKDNLIRDGYAKRKDHSDRRAFVLELTEKGRELTTVEHEA